MKNKEDVDKVDLLTQALFKQATHMLWEPELHPVTTALVLQFHAQLINLQCT